MNSKKPFSVIPEYGDVNDAAVRAKYGYLEGMVSIIGNTLLFIVKFVIGLTINSIALLADAVHTLSDVQSSLVVIVGFKLSNKPADRTHPYGYGRVEYIATLIIAFLLIITGFGFIQQSIERVLQSISITHQEYGLILGVLLVVTAFIKEGMARFSFVLSKKIESDILKADAWHHRTDALTSVGVGVSLIGSSYGFPILDPIFGIIVSIIIVYVGIRLGKTSAQFLIGKSADDDFIDRIKEIGRQIHGVRNLHDISVHDYGANKIITLHAEVDKELLLDDAHRIADDLEQSIKQKIHCSTIIHVEPVDLQRGTFRKRKLIEAVLRKQKQVISFHNIHIIRRPEKDDISMHLIVDKKMSIQDSHKLCHQIKALIQNAYGSCDVHVHLEPCKQADCSICKTRCKT